MAELFLTRAEDPHTALLFEDDLWTWRRFSARRRSRRRPAGAASPDDRPWHVGVLLENVPEYLFLIAGAALSGATVVGINPTRRGAELAADIRAPTSTRSSLDAASRRPARGHRPRRRARWSASTARSTPRCSSARRRAGRGERDRARPAHHAGPALHLRLHRRPQGRHLLDRAAGRPSASVNPLIRSARRRGVQRDAALPRQRPDGRLGAVPPARCRRSAMRRKFSASGFLPDVLKFDATFFNYVGRSLAYVLAQPERPEEERDNRLRIGFGTEASARDRDEFLRRFGAPVYGVVRLLRGRLLHHATRRDARRRPRRAADRPRPGHLGRRRATSARDAEFDDDGDAAQPRGGDRRDRLARRRGAVRGLLPQPRGERRASCATATSAPATSATATRTASSTSPVARPTGCGWTPRTSPPRRSSASWPVSPASPWPPSTRCRTRRPVTR